MDYGVVFGAPARLDWLRRSNTALETDWHRPSEMHQKNTKDLLTFIPVNRTQAVTASRVQGHSRVQVQRADPNV